MKFRPTCTALVVWVVQKFGPVRPKEVAHLLGSDPSTTAAVLHSLARKNRIDRIAKGLYDRHVPEASE